MKHHVDLKNHKVLLGLFSLLFVTSIVHTSAILKNKNGEKDQQAAQVSSSSSCITVKHRYNQIFSNPFAIVHDTGLPRPDDYNYTVNFDIINGCSRPISIIDPGSLNGIDKAGMSTVSYFGIDGLAGGGASFALTPLPGNIYNVNPVWENGVCIDCGQGSLLYRHSSLGTDVSQGQPALRVFTLAAGQTRNFDMTVAVSVPHSTEDPGWLRARLLRVKWFYTNAYTDGLITADEVKTLNLSSAQQEQFATDWTIITQDGNGPFMCPEGESPAFDAMYQPVCQ